MRSVRAAAALTAATVLVGGCADLAAINESRHDTKTFAFEGEQLTIDSKLADLRLVAGRGDAVEVERSLTGKATIDGNASWSLRDAVLRLSVTCSGIVPDCGGHHIVHVPPGVAVAVTSDGGPVRAVGLAADLTVRVVDSWLRVEDPAGTLRLDAEYGAEVTGARSTDVTATSRDRDVSLTFAVAPTRVEARAAAGRVAVTVPAGPETYRITAAGNSGLTSDPTSDRSISAVARDAGGIRVERAN